MRGEITYFQLYQTGFSVIKISTTYTGIDKWYKRRILPIKPYKGTLKGLFVMNVFAEGLLTMMDGLSTRTGTCQRHTEEY